MLPATEQRAAFLAGFVAAEGTFTGTTLPRPRFRFAVGLGASDAGMCNTLHEFFAVGSIVRSPRRRDHYDDEIAFTVQSTRALVEVMVPFMDAHLPPSYKREQYEAWRARLLEHWELRAKRVRPCTVEGCELPRRAHGLCRGHLWVARRV